MSQAQSKFRIGDVVILKSGGPPMTVHNIGEYSMQGLEVGVACVYFDSGKRIEELFHPDTLEHFDSAG